MLKKVLFLATILVVVFSLIYSCKKTDSISGEQSAQKKTSSLSSFTNPRYPMNIRLAQRYYNNLVREQGDIVKSSNEARKNEVNRKKPIWSKAYAGSTESTTFVEVPIVYNRASSFIITTKDQVLSKDDEKKLLNGSFDRLIITKDKATGKVSEYIVSYLPTLEYLNAHNRDASKNYIHKLQNDFSGLLQYKKWDGTPVSLSKVEAGKVVRTFKNYFKPQGTDPSNSQARLVCVASEQYCQVQWDRTCFEIWTGEDYWSDCTEWQGSINYCWSECTQWQDDGITDPQDPPNDPTDPMLAWIIKMNATLGEEDSYEIVDINTLPGDAQTFSTVENFNSYIKGGGAVTFSEGTEVNDTKELTLSVNKTFIAGYDIDFLMEKTAPNTWVLKSITSNMWGVHPGWSYDYKSHSSGTDNTGKLTVEVKGTIKYYIIIEGIGTVYTDKVKNNVTIDQTIPKITKGS